MTGVGLFIGGLVLLIVAAEMVVRGASRVAFSLGIKPLVLGLTVVAVGTSMPELAIGITASLQGSGALTIGNIAGTNIFNILFILGLSALLKPLPLQLRILRLELPVILGTAAMMTGLAWDGILSRLDGLVLFGTAIVYTVGLIRTSRKESRSVKQEFNDMYAPGDARGQRTLAQAWLADGLLLTLGLVLSVLGAHWLVAGSVNIARGLGISEAIIGLTIVAMGTSAPELATTIVATLRDERDVAVGNLIGSSIYNILVILGITCIVAPDGVPVERQLLWFDIPLMAGVMIACIPVFVTGRRVSRLEGGLFVAIFIAYMSWIVGVRA